MPSQPYCLIVQDRSGEHSFGRDLAFVSRVDRTVYLRWYADTTLYGFAEAAADAGMTELAYRLGLGVYSADERIRQGSGASRVSPRLRQ